MKLALGPTEDKVIVQEALDDYDNALKLDEEKGPFKKSRQGKKGAAGGKAAISEDDLVKPN